MATQSEFMLTPVGRLVQGSLAEPYTKDATGRERERPQYFVAVAFEKRNAGTAALWQKIHAKALADWRNGEPNRADFAWKILDGDAPAHAHKEGWAGCMVFRLTSGYPPRVYDSGNPPQPIDPRSVKPGYYVRCNIGVRGNDSLQTPGMFLNLDMVQLCGYGAEIQTGPDAASVFGTAPEAPAGMQTMPPAPTSAPPAAPAQPAPPAAAGWPAAAPAQPAPQGAPSGPDWGFLNPQQPR